MKITNGEIVRNVYYQCDKCLKDIAICYCAEDIHLFLDVPKCTYTLITEEIDGE